MLLWPPVKIPACDGQVETQVWITEDSVDMQIHEGYFARSWICNWNCCCSVTRLCPTLWDLTDCRTTGLSLSFTVSRTLIKLMSIESVMPSNHLILCYPLLLLTSIFPRIRVFSNESVLQIRWPKCWSFSFSISLSNEYLGLISFRTDWFGLLAVQGTLKILLQHHNVKAFGAQASLWFNSQHLYMTAGKTVALTRLTFVGKMMSLLFNTLSGLS